MDNPRRILSASRRTDIPGWYTPWFLDSIDQGVFRVTNPYNRTTREIDASPEAVHTIVFWSKNFGPFLDLGAHRILRKKGYHLYFNFTINSPSPLLEPGIPGLDRRLDQAARLARDLDPAHIAWRFDPICFYLEDNIPKTNLEGFESIATRLSALGIRRCVTSFYDPYPKVARRIRRKVRAGAPEIEFTDPGPETRKKVIQQMAGTLAALSMDLFLCCENTLSDQLALVENIYPNACIDGRLYRRLFGGNPETARDYGQRKDQGCQCTRSVDIGSYDRHPCHHNCLFCYARTEFDTSG